MEATGVDVTVNAYNWSEIMVRTVTGINLLRSTQSTHWRTLILCLNQLECSYTSPGGKYVFCLHVL
jgi:hypothetical protein